MIVYVKRLNIDENGWLEVLWGSIRVTQHCPFACETPCGIWCPLCSGIYTDATTGRRAVAVCQDRILEEEDDETDDRD